MIEERVLALAGMLQALKQVRRIAESGQADATVLTTALDSVFRIEADRPEDVYGGVQAVAPGLRLLHGYFRNEVDDQQLPRIALSVLQLERRFIRDAGVGEAVHEGILATAPEAARLGSTHPEVLGALGQLYAGTVSHLRPKVLVQGNPHYLGQVAIVAEIRAVLLAALRSAVLWRQLGGSYFDFLLQRRRMSEIVDDALG